MISRLLSVEPSSRTTISLFGHVCASAVSMERCSHGAPLKQGIRMLTSGFTSNNTSTNSSAAHARNDGAFEQAGKNPEKFPERVTVRVAQFVDLADKHFRMHDRRSCQR